MGDCEKEMFDLSNVKINENTISGFKILDSFFAFNGEKNCRELIIVCSGEDCINQINNEDLFNNLTFTFSIGENVFFVEVPFAYSYQPMLSRTPSLKIHFYISRIYRKNVVKGFFHFKLFNISKNITTHWYGTSDRRSRSRLPIVVASKNWELINYNYSESYLRNRYYINGILTLQTASTYEDARDQMKYICEILSFISQKDVRCLEAYDENNLLVETFFNKAEPYGNDDEIIKIFTHSLPSDLIKIAYCKYMKDPQWWATTFEYFIEAKSARSLETKIMLHCMQLERLLKKFSPPVTPIIDENLDEKEIQIVEQLTLLLTNMLDNWDSTRSSSLFNTIKGWNNSRSLKNAIKTFADFFEIPYLSGKIVDIRGKIAHNGVIGNRRVEYSSNFQLYKELELFIIIAILKIFEYKGNFTHLYFSYPVPESKSMASLEAGTKLSELCKMRVS